MLSDYQGGRSLYAAFATYHAYLEFPVVIALALNLAPTPGRRSLA
jgi:hypothetical protein